MTHTVEIFAPGAVALFVFFGVTTVLFAWRRNHEMIRSRMPLLTIFQAVISLLACWLFYLTLSFDLDTGGGEGGRFEIPCLAAGLVSTLLGTCWALLLFVKVSKVILLHAINQTSLQYTNRSDRKFQKLGVIERIVIRAQLFFHERRAADDTMEALVSIENLKSHGTDGDPNLWLMDISKNINGKLLTAVIVIGTLSSGLIFIPQCLIFGTHTRAGRCEKLDFIFMDIFIIVVMYIINPALLISLRRIKDNFNMKRELIWALAIFIIFYTLYMLASFEWIPLIAPLGDYCWALLTCVVLYHLIVVVWPLLETFRPNSHEIHGGPQLAYNQESFDKTLNTPALYARFKEVVAQDFCMENLLFHEFYLQVLAMPNLPDQVAIVLKSRFLNAGAPHELNLTSAVKKRHLENLKKLGMFREVLKSIHDEVVLLLYTNSFPKFLRRERVSTGSRSTKSTDSKSHNTDGKTVGADA
ncbi:hypothetical protein HK102_008649 [Quaeritorhiza haematococci]|nr:hypothetical protein HK102_008649 [Quaeritorhiza haematococci]